MTPHPFKLVFIKDDTTGTGFACHEGCAFLFDQAVKLVASGLCRIADDEPDKAALEEAVRARKRSPSVRWELVLCQPRYFQGNS
jgi:hypothetical protein